MNDKTYVNLIYLDRASTRFAFLIVALFFFIPNFLITIGLIIILGMEGVRQKTILLPLGLYTIFTYLMIILSFFIFENNKEKSIKILDGGIVYNSLLKKFAVPWEAVKRIRLDPLTSLRPTVTIDTTKGMINFTGMFICLEDEIPRIQPGFIRPKFYYPSGGKYDNNIYKNALYLDLKDIIPEKFF